MSDKIIYLHPSADKKPAPDKGKKPIADKGSKSASDKRSRKRRLSPEFSWRSYKDLKPRQIEGYASNHYYNKIKILFYRYGLWQQIIIDEDDCILAGSLLFKDLKHKCHQIPVFLIPGLSQAEKRACFCVARDWERQLAYVKIRAEEKRHD
jgi:hypothetical protein